MLKKSKNILLRIIFFAFALLSLVSCERQKDRIRRANEEIMTASAKYEESQTTEIATDATYVIEETEESVETEEIEETEETIERVEITFDSEKAKEEREKRRRNLESKADQDGITDMKISMDMSFPFATYSVINDGSATLYMVGKNVPNYKGIIVTVNAGHGTKNGSRYKTYSHPDFSPKVAGGSTAVGEVYSYAVSEGTTFIGGIKEADANLMIALLLKEKLLNDGYSVLMIREDNECRLDNIARTVLANEYSDAHVSIHFDTTAINKGVFYVKPINVESYLNMEPLKSNYENIIKLGQSILDGYRSIGVKIWKESGMLEGDLTQLSYSIIPSVDIELGDRASEFTEEIINKLVDGLKLGIDIFFTSNSETQSE